VIQAVVFDFDGLIVDTESLWFDVFRETMLEYECDLKIEDFAVCVGTNADVLYTKLSELARKPIDRSVIQKVTDERYKEKIHELELREGVLNYLQAAKERGLKIGLASSSSRKWVVEFLHQFGIQDYFEVIKTSDDVKKVKPDPELYLQAVEELGVHAREALAFEDSKNGLIAAVQAGLHCIIVPNRVTRLLDFSEHVHRLSSMAEIEFDELLHFLERKILHRLPESL